MRTLIRDFHQLKGKVIRFEDGQYYFDRNFGGDGYTKTPDLEEAWVFDTFLVLEERLRWDLGITEPFELLPVRVRIELEQTHQDEGELERESTQTNAPSR